MFSGIKSIKILLFSFFGFLLIGTIFLIFNKIPKKTNADELKRENELFTVINLDYPGLEKVKKFETQGNRNKAKEALIDYYRLRQKPTWPVNKEERPKQPEFLEDEKENYIEEASRVLDREFSYYEKEAKLDKIIDWDANPADDAEWTALLNGHFHWYYLGRAYWETYDEKYAKDFVDQLRSWLTLYPELSWLPEDKYPWRNTLVAAWRMDNPWIYAFVYFSDSPNFTTQDRVSMLHSIWQHAEYLLKSKHTGNALVAELTSLFNIATMFPEFKEAPEWKETAIDGLYKELNNQFYPDGAQTELSPHYHMVSLRKFVQAYQLAQKYEIPLPQDFIKRLEKVFEYALYIIKPDFKIPMLNDSDYDQFDMEKWLNLGAELFNRKDMLFAASGGSFGEKPQYTSYSFPYAGFYITRSGWNKEALYLLFEAGPFGLHHQHEDKLQIDVYAYGRSLILDPGRYTYSSGPWRNYFLNTTSHNTITVDEYGQQRRTNQSSWITKNPLENRWISNNLFDFATGSYTEGYGTNQQMVHIRKVLFVKNDYWIVSDRLYEGNPKDNHAFSSRFQFDTVGATIEPDTYISSTNNDDANLLIIPIKKGEFTAEIFEGQDDPPAGWIGWNYNVKTPASQIVYEWEEATPAGFDVIIKPYKGKIKPNITVRPLLIHGSDVTALEIQTEKGTDQIIIQHKIPNPVNINQSEIKAEVAISRYDLKKNLISSAVTIETGTYLNSFNFPSLVIDKLNPLIKSEIVDENTLQIKWGYKKPLKVWVDYGYAAGGGYIFQTPKTENFNKEGKITLFSLNPDFKYIFRIFGQTENNEFILLDDGVFTTKQNK